jgi:hypothetical protein
MLALVWINPYTERRKCSLGRRRLLDVFALRERVIKDYHSYVGSFIRIEEQVTRSLDEGLLWPDPLIQLNPAFETLETVDRGWSGA